MTRERLACLVLCSASGCSLVLDFSESAATIDATIDGPASATECAYHEPNNTLAEAMVFAPTDVGPAGLCTVDGTDDHDFYRFTVPANTLSVEIKVTFVAQPSGDLDLKLYDKTGGSVATSRGFTGEEKIICPAASPLCPQLAADDYVFEVFPGLAGAQNRYDLSLIITPM